jgi:hypothetical protein
MSDREMDPYVVAAQIGKANLMAISGLRINIDQSAPGRYPDLLLPVSQGYRVRISLDASDTYIVTREMKRGAKLFVKGVQTDVYCEDLGEVAYQASCYKNVDFGAHKATWS